MAVLTVGAAQSSQGTRGGVRYPPTLEFPGHEGRGKVPQKESWEFAVKISLKFQELRERPGGAVPVWFV